MFIREILKKVKSAGIPVTLKFKTSPVGNENIKIFQNYRVDIVYDDIFTIVGPRENAISCVIENVKAIVIDFSK